MLSPYYRARGHAHMSSVLKHIYTAERSEDGTPFLAFRNLRTGIDVPAGELGDLSIVALWRIATTTTCLMGPLSPKREF